jgi:large subunit ribosomal protein L25
MNLNFLAFREGMLVDIPIRVINEDQSPGIRRGAFFLQVSWSLRVRALSADIPEFIEVDLSGASNKEVVRMNRLILPDTIECITTDPNFTVGTVVGKRIAAS